MKKLYYFYSILGIAVLLVVVSCVKYDGYDYGKQNGWKDNNAVLSVEQAREFFEKEYLETVTRAGRDQTHVHDESCAGVHGEAQDDGATVTGNGAGIAVATDTPHPKMLVPEEFTPDWNGSAVASDSKIGKVVTPISGEVGMVATRFEFRANGRVAFYKAKVTQRLYTIKNANEESAGVFVETIIPDRDSRGKSIPADILSDGGDFSGIVLRHTLNSSFVSYNVLKDGKVVGRIHRRQINAGNRVEVNRIINDAIGLLRDYLPEPISRYGEESASEKCALHNRLNCSDRECVAYTICTGCGSRDCDGRDCDGVNVVVCRHCGEQGCGGVCQFICDFCGKLFCRGECIDIPGCLVCRQEPCTCYPSTGNPDDNEGNNSGTPGGNFNGGSTGSGGGGTGEKTYEIGPLFFYTEEDYLRFKRTMPKVFEIDECKKIQEYFDSTKKNVKIQYVEKLPYGAKALYDSSSNTIYMTDTNETSVFIEELVHAYDFHIDPDRTIPKGNREAAAKIITQKICDNNDVVTHWNADTDVVIKEYNKNPSNPKKKSDFEGAMDQMGYTTDEFPRNLDSLSFSTYESLYGKRK